MRLCHAPWLVATGVDVVPALDPLSAEQALITCTAHPPIHLLSPLPPSLAPPPFPPPPAPSCAPGLNLGSYDGALAGVVQRLLVAPAATRYLFHQKVQSVQQLRQR